MGNTARTRAAALCFIAWLLVLPLLFQAVVTPIVPVVAEACYLPVVFRSWPPVPGPPTLSPIDNGDGDGNYALHWTAAPRAETYELQEKYNTQDWFNAYLGAATQVDLRNRPAGTYTYRCRARNSWGEGSWSNEVSAVVQGKAPGDISRPSCTHISAGGQSKVNVINDCPYVLYLDFTGPQPLAMQIPKCDVCKKYVFIGPIFCPTSGRPTQEQQLSPGDYRLFVTVNDPGVRPFTGNWALSGDCRYTVCFYIVTSWSSNEGAQRELVPGDCD